MRDQNRNLSLADNYEIADRGNVYSRHSKFFIENRDKKTVVELLEYLIEALDRDLRNKLDAHDSNGSMKPLVSIVDAVKKDYIGRNMTSLDNQFYTDLLDVIFDGSKVSFIKYATVLTGDHANFKQNLPDRLRQHGTNMMPLTVEIEKILTLLGIEELFVIADLLDNTFNNRWY